jgi:cytochrome c biogenesis protein CcmG/thiol:disulfide interchange protein DsbE
LSYKALLRPIGWRAIGIGVLLLAVGCSSPGGRESRVKPASARRAAPDFALKDGDGKTVRLSSYRGKVVLLNFWATWCGPCMVEIPWFIDFERHYREQGFAVLGVSMDENGWRAVKPFVSELGINYRVVLGDDTVAQLYGGINALPTTFIIDREGRVAAIHQGLVSKSKYENDLRELFESPSRSTGAHAPGVPAVAVGAR